jgi:hypothetical protein
MKEERKRERVGKKKRKRGFIFSRPTVTSSEKIVGVSNYVAQMDIRGPK